MAVPRQAAARTPIDEATAEGGAIYTSAPTAAALAAIIPIPAAALPPKPLPLSSALPSQIDDSLGRTTSMASHASSEADDIVKFWVAQTRAKREQATANEATARVEREAQLEATFGSRWAAQHRALHAMQRSSSGEQPPVTRADDSGSAEEMGPSPYVLPSVADGGRRLSCVVPRASDGPTPMDAWRERATTLASDGMDHESEEGEEGEEGDEGDEGEEEAGVDEAVPFFDFDEPSTPEFVLFSPSAASASAQPVRSEIRGATPTKLVERLTNPSFVDQDFVTAFLLTYRSFTTPTRLLAMLRGRFDVPMPHNVTAAELATFYRRMVVPIRLRVVNVIKHWLRRHAYDFEGDPKLRAACMHFAEQLAAAHSSYSEQARKIVEDLDRAAESEARRISLISDADDADGAAPTPPPPTVPALGLARAFADASLLGTPRTDGSTPRHSVLSPRAMPSPRDSPPHDSPREYGRERASSSSRLSTADLLPPADASTLPPYPRGVDPEAVVTDDGASESAMRAWSMRAKQQEQQPPPRSPRASLGGSKRPSRLGRAALLDGSASGQALSPPTQFLPPPGSARADGTTGASTASGGVCEESGLEGGAPTAEFARPSMADSSRVSVAADSPRLSQLEGTRASSSSSPRQALPPSRVYLPPRTENVSTELLALPPRAVAEFLALQASVRFQRVEPSECLCKAWMVPALKHRARHVLACSAHFNAVSFWMQWELTFESSEKQRARIMCRFVEVASECLKLNCFSAAFAIYSGFTSSSIHRLELTKKAMAREASKEVLAAYEALPKQLSHEHNFRSPLQLLERCAPPCVPFLGIFQKQIVAVEEGSPDMLPAQTAGGLPLINFAKRRKLSEIIGKIQTFQSGSYAFTQHAACARYVGQRISKWEAALLEGSLVGDTSYKDTLEGILDKASQRCEPRKQKTAPACEQGSASTARRGSLDTVVGGSTPNLNLRGGRPLTGPRRGSMP